ncbi:MAG: DUF177 domain-containing protein [Bacteroidetes bacterium]|nr:DUF177 domain-containing protein [Bacteroidota bacterium]
MAKSKYYINFGGLSIGVHEFEFDIDKTFFAELDEFNKIELKVVVVLTKQNNLLSLVFNIKGLITIDCDRCLAEYEIPLVANEKLVIKHGNPEESTDEILVLAEGAETIDLKQPIYEFVTVALPLRKVPCEINSKYKCDNETLKKLESISIKNSKNNSDANNPMWEQLNKVKYNKN